MNDNRIHAMIALKSFEWARKVVWTFIGYVWIGAEDCLGLHFIRLVSVGGSLELSQGLRPRTPTSFSSLDGKKGSKRRSRRWSPSSWPDRCRGLFRPSWGAYGRRRRFVGAFTGASPPQPDLLFFPWWKKSKQKKIKAMIAFILAEWAQRIVLAFMGCVW